MTRYARLLGYAAAGLLINAALFALAAFALDEPAFGWLAGAAVVLLAAVVAADIARGVAEARTARRDR